VRDSHPAQFLQRLRKGYSRILGIVIVLLGFTPSLSHAQTELDISSCYNPLLQQKVDYTSDVRLALATLAQVTEADYEVTKHDASLAGQYGFISGSANYADFDDKRRQYFQLNKLDLQYYQSISVSTRTLDSKAYDLIKDCIDKVAAVQYGFHYLFKVDDPKIASLQLFWRPTEGGGPLEITDSVLLNAKVKTQGVADGKLLPYVSRWSFTPYPKIQGALGPILMERTDVEKNINCTVSTKPQVKTFDMVIPPVAKPSIDIVCTTVYDTNDPVTGRRYGDGDRVAWPLNVTDGHGCSDCHGYSFEMNAPGPVTDVTCTSSGDHVWQEVCTFDGNHIRASGYENANPRTLYIDYHYKITRQDCKFRDMEKQKTTTQGKPSVLKSKS
jgi:hypothetical protein